MVKPVYGRALKPGSLSQLSRFTRGYQDAMAQFLIPLCSQDYFFKFYDFDNDTITGDFTVSNGGGTAVSDFAASTSLEFGQLTGSTGTSNDATAAIGITFDGIFFDAARNPGVMARIKYDAVSAMYSELSICDAPTTVAVLNWSDVDGATPTQASNGVTDIASVVCDTSQTNKSFRLCTVGTTDTTTLGKNLSAATTTAGDPVAAATFSTQLLQVGALSTTPAAGESWCYANIDGKQSNEAFSKHGTTDVQQGLDSGIKIKPQFMVQARSATAVVVTIDYIAIWSDRV